MIEIVKAQTNDIIQVADLVSKVTQRHILEHFTEEGKRRFLARIGQDVTQAITHPDFFALAAFHDSKVVGFAALKDDNYLTHLFVATKAQATMVWVNNFSIRYWTQPMISQEVMCVFVQPPTQFRFITSTVLNLPMISARKKEFVMCQCD